MEPLNDTDQGKRAERLWTLMDDYIKRMTPQQRDRILQVHLAQARGPVRNLRLLCDSTALLLRARRTIQTMEEPHVDE